MPEAKTIKVKLEINDKKRKWTKKWYQMEQKWLQQLFGPV